MTIQLKLLKLAKNLNKFSFDEFLIISEESKEAVQAFITEAVENKNIKQIDKENFVFISLPRPEQNIKKESRLLKIGARTFRPEKN